MGVREEILKDVIGKLRLGGKLEEDLIDRLGKSLNTGDLSKDSLRELIRKSVADGDKDKKA